MPGDSGPFTFAHKPSNLLFFYILIMTAAWVAVSIYLLIKSFTIASLSAVSVPETAAFPAVAIIIPIRNEAMHLEQALNSICKLRYPFFSVTLMEDRSTDGTPDIVDRFASRYQFVKALHIRDLPDGWLGKNHALYLGSTLTTEPWILFTDADVAFEPDTLQKAMQYVKDQRLDHLTIFPDVASRSMWLNSVLETFKLMLEIRLKPWEVKDPESTASIGIGAFNLVRRHAYESIGTHHSFAMRPDDDLKLGEKLKSGGFRSDVVYGKGQIGLEWYTGLGEFVNGLMKNTFSGFGYSILKVIPAALLTILVFVLPVPTAFTYGNWTAKFMGLIILSAQSILYLCRPGQRARWWYVLMIPFAGLLMTYILLASAIKTLRQGGIYWRGHFYPLVELRKQR